MEVKSCCLLHASSSFGTVAEELFLLEKHTIKHDRTRTSFFGNRVMPIIKWRLLTASRYRTCDVEWCRRECSEASGGPAAAGTRSDLQSIIQHTARSQRVQRRAQERYLAEGDSSKCKEEIKLTTDSKNRGGEKSGYSESFDISFLNKCDIVV